MNQIPSKPDTMTFYTPFIQLKERCTELQFNGWYVESLEPDLDDKIRVVAKPLKPGMARQQYSDLDIKQLLIKIVMHTEETVRAKRLFAIACAGRK